MSRVIHWSLSLTAVVLASSLGSASQLPVSAVPPASALSGCEGLPSSLVVDPRLRLLILDMRRRAPTFRRQVARLVDQPGLVVTVGVWPFPKAEDVGARTHLTVEKGRLRTADVQIRIDAARLVVELIAHEFEQHPGAARSDRSRALGRPRRRAPPGRTKP
jgi:hypothetical protein